MAGEAKHGSDSDHSDGGGGQKGAGGRGSRKSRRELPAGAVTILKAWLLSPEHFTHPYPTPQDQIMLMQKTGIDKKQLKNWFTNARRRIWKPMLKKQLEQGKLAATGAGGGGVAVPGVVPGLMVPPPGTGATPGGAPAPAADGKTESPHSVQAMQTHYQQAVQQQDQPQQQQQQSQQQSQQYDQYGNPVYAQQNVQPNHPGAPQQFGSQQYYQYSQQQQDSSSGAPPTVASSGSIGSLPPISSYPSQSSTTPATGTDMRKNDSHAVLMELFARDQDLVRQAAESAKMKAAAKGGDQPAAPPKVGSMTKLSGVPSMNSWPHFSSISSLNNLGTMTGVKSIASLSGADLASQGNLNKMGNLAQVKSVESMGKNDSYAFLEVFFGDRGSSTNLSGKQQDSGGRGVKREREEDNDVGLSLDADESPSTTTMKQPVDSDAPRAAVGAPQPAPLPPPSKDAPAETGTLKRAYDDALAARGLISVSRSCEKLSDLALPAKMQRTLSQEYLRQHHQQQQQQQQAQPQTQTPQYGQYTYVPPPAAAAAPPSDQSSPPVTSQQYPGQNPGQQSQATDSSQPSYNGSALSDPANASVEVAATTTCALCQKTNVDTQLRPCGHMFHERCLKPSLQTPMGQPRCPVDQMPMESALLAVPTDENTQVPPPQPQRAWNEPKSAFQSGPVSTTETPAPS